LPMGGIEKPPPGNRSSNEKLMLKIKTKSRIANVQPELKLIKDVTRILPNLLLAAD